MHQDGAETVDEVDRRIQTKIRKYAARKVRQGVENSGKEKQDLEHAVEDDPKVRKEGDCGGEEVRQTADEQQLDSEQDGYRGPCDIDPEAVQQQKTDQQGENNKKLKGISDDCYRWKHHLGDIDVIHERAIGVN